MHAGRANEHILVALPALENHGTGHLNSADAAGGRSKVLILELQGYIDQSDQNGHLQKRPDHGRKSLARFNAENGNGDGNGQFEII